MKFLSLAAAFSLFLALNVRAEEPAAPAGGEGKKPEAGGEAKKGERHRPTKEEMLKKFDKDGDGKLNEEEKKAALAAVKKLKDKSSPGDAPAPSIKAVPDDDAKTPAEVEKAPK